MCAPLMLKSLAFIHLRFFCGMLACQFVTTYISSILELEILICLGLVSTQFMKYTRNPGSIHSIYYVYYSRPGSEKIYMFSELAVEMNEPEAGVAPTDSRLRPDQRLMEEGKWDESNRVKLELEERQRGVRKKREAEQEKAKSEGEQELHHT